MELIDKGKLLEWLRNEMNTANGWNAVHVGLLKRLEGEIESGAFDPPAPEPPKWNGKIYVGAASSFKPESLELIEEEPPC